MKNLKTAFIAAAAFFSAHALADVTFYENEDFHGRAITTGRALPDFRRSGLDDRASSVIVDKGTWEVCEDPGYTGRCVLLRPGNYDSLKQLGVNNRISSARSVKGGAKYNDYYTPEPQPVADYEYRRRANEKVYEADVISSRAVLARSEQRCWVEREKVEKRGGRNVVGGVIGGVIGGVLGHQIGSGTGQDIATAGGAVAGAAIGSSAGRDKNGYSRDVQRCETDDGEPEYWDVTYRYRGVMHHVQMTSPPGRFIYVNKRGEPRQ
ncbi:MAG: beta/gamma crystallin-related protein [Steroidobacteraceae bacterium]